MSDPNRTVELPRPEEAPLVPADSTPQPERIGRYRVERLLGRGGFGLVYLAHDEQLQRLVAIKVPHARLVAEASDAEAYLAEARTVANLDHPNIVPVHDVGSTEDYPCYVVSKFIDGIDLASRLKHARLSLHEAVELVATVAEALHYAHKQGLVHRDIKPGNLLLDASGKPFVADFGLALREQDVGKGPRYAGTPAYMSPEQARGEGHRVDGRSDLFSLGVVFYELLTGRRPFHGETREELLEQITSLEARPPRQSDDRIPKELERICLKALSKRASERYTTAKDMGDDLRHWLRPLSGGRGAAEGGTASALIEPELPPASGLIKDAFISYASPDKEAAYRLCRLLEEKGIGCWIAPRDVTPGADYGEAIIGAIEATAATVLLLSAHANASIHVTHEVERATSKRKRLIPIRLEDIRPLPSLELHLATAQWVDAWRFPPEQVADQLASALRGQGNKPGTPSGLSDQQPIKIVPKGLRSFDAGDADFFLELLPGPRDREGLPESIRFWKTRIETTDPDSTFSVGLIYGPSGCGKSSLVKAGLLPRLAKPVTPVYVEATAEETEARLLKGLRRQVAGLPRDLGLVESLAALRRGRFLESGQKVLLVLDQFEQWLHARRSEEDTELVQALRQCDGGRVQSIVMVRDDFWLAATRFMAALDIPIVQGDNFATVDLFDPLHARKVLAEFGRAYGRLPDNLGGCTPDQEAFLDRAVSGLAQDGKVVSVRLALFAEMVKGKPWTPATLKEVGGTEGVGITFLEETFSASHAPPQHRLHQKAARFVLKALLPEQGSDIKGNLWSHQDLLEASGYANRPRDFEQLLRILDGELRLLTPTDPEGIEAGPPLAEGRYYQLTHDYLVPSLRDWLTRKQKETMRGRAELRLAERAASWNARPENRHLPAWWEWLDIRLLTPKKNWTPPQRRMMRQAARYQAVRGVALVVLLAATTLIGLSIRGQVIEQSNADHAAGLVHRLLDQDISKVPGIITEMQGYRRWTDPLLRQENEEAKDGSRQKLYTSLALLPVYKGQADYLYGQLLDAGPTELPVIREALLGHRDALVGRLWGVLEDARPERGPRFRAACALAAYDVTGDKANRQRWQGVSPFVADHLLAAVQQNPSHYDPLLKTLSPIRDRLTGPLSEVFRNHERPAADRSWAANILAEYAADRPDVLTDLLLDADDKQFAVLRPKAEAQRQQVVPICESTLAVPLETQKTDEGKERLAKRQANAGVALLRLGRAAKVWPLLKHRPDPRARSYLIHRLSPLGADPKALVERLDVEKEVSIRRALLLSLGAFTPEQFPLAEREPLIAEVLRLYRDDPDAGLHGAAEWLLRQWQQEDKVKAAEQEWAKDKQKREERLEQIRQELAKAKGGGQGFWYVNGQGQTLAVIHGPVEFLMGSPPTEAGRERGPAGKSETQHLKRIGRSYAIAAREVTVGQFLLGFRKYYDYNKQYAPTADCPVNRVTWYDAAAYCNWLSKEEGIPEDQWCYEANTQGQFAAGMKLSRDYLNRTGYRLPSEAEWEYACRAGAVTSRYYGETEELLGKYAWYTKNSQFRGMLPGKPGRLGVRGDCLKPNDLGLFDMLGNAAEWCQEHAALYSPGPNGRASEDREDKKDIKDDLIRVLRGGTFGDQAVFVRSAVRTRYFPPDRNFTVGFRPARTLLP